MSQAVLTVEIAAVQGLDGVVYSVPQPGRHCDVLAQMYVLGHLGPVQGEQGFVLSDGRFVGRVEAKAVALAAGQIRRGRGKFPELYSEDLW